MADAAITNLHDSTSVDRETGAVRSVQAAELSLSAQALGSIWSPAYLERLARTYWRFLTRVTLGLVRIHYTECERFVVLLFKPLKLLTFRAPEYELDDEHGVVRWRIERGLLVARAGRHGDGHLQIDVRRLPSTDPSCARLHVEVEVANFYPAIAFGISRWLYNVTQSRIHVIVTQGFLRSLTRLDLAESRVGRFAQAADGVARSAQSAHEVEHLTATTDAAEHAAEPVDTTLPTSTAHAATTQSERRRTAP